MDGAGDSFKTS